MSTQYETLYGVQLLDDLHNYFPALLYDTARFQNVRDVLGYLTTNARNRFDLFSYGQRNYHQSALPAQSVNRSVSPPVLSRPATANGSAGARDLSGVQQRQAHAARSYADVLGRNNTNNSILNSFITQPGSSVLNSLFHQPGHPMTASVEVYEDLTFDNPAMSLMSLLNALGPSTLGNRMRAPNMEDVVVSATEEEIEAASTRAFPDNQTTCSICQDDIDVNEMCRKLNHCGHTFHIRCIDTWFSRNVHCPICRHDIREVDESVSAAASSSSS